MLISPAWAHGSLIRDEAHGSGTALLIILGVVIALLLVYRGRQKWRRNKLKRGGGGA